MIQAIISVFIPTSGGGDVSDEEAKVYIGIWIVLNIWWVCSWILTLGRRYFHNKEEAKRKEIHLINKRHFWKINFDFRESFFLESFDFVMKAFWVLFLIILGGCWIAYFL